VSYAIRSSIARLAAPPTTIVIADDHPLIRKGLRIALESAGETVVGEAADGVATLAIIAKTQPDLVILDIDMPKMNGLAVMRHLVECPSGLRSSVCRCTTLKISSPSP